jgi:hypothetical protein
MFASGPAIQKLSENRDIEILSEPVEMVKPDGSLVSFEELS